MGKFQKNGGLLFAIIIGLLGGVSLGIICISWQQPVTGVAMAEFKQQKVAVIKGAELTNSSAIQRLEQTGKARVNGGCSGFFISPTQVATANHCIQESDATVELSHTGELFQAKLVQAVPEMDLAILQVQDSAKQAVETLPFRSVVEGEVVTILSEHAGTYQTSVAKVANGYVSESGSNLMELNYIREADAGKLAFVQVPSQSGDSGSLVLGADGAFLGVISGSDNESFTLFVSHA